MCLHPDDSPISILGLSRIVSASTEADYTYRKTNSGYFQGTNILDVFYAI
ncbi:hypothetical protein [Flavivirga spongiicola]|uniref:Uncharacterized protein n=1 Tax=Flavivirga spongiicola TaxID=421621 RepID=A0ABU7XQU5_9FLAO|nr:hypothetical protein [Flavivirga sp. MEBiC05379]MDO5977936.1 hypothetical protein [Flavivirga sp. MEBiC05379]